MRRTLRFIALGAILSLIAVGGWVWTGGSAHAAQNASVAPRAARVEATGRVRLLSVALAPSVPTDPAIFGIKAAGAPWFLTHGRARLSRDGAFRVNVVGLVLSNGTNPVPDLAAAVYCNGSLSATTVPVPYSTKGNAHINTTVALPALCAAPAVLLEPATGSALSDVIAVYIGFDGKA